MREIVLDTETTGLSPQQGHRIVEIGCVELLNRIPSGQTYHVYINPQRDMPKEAEQVHGLSSAFLSDKPTFSQIVESFVDFISDSPLVIHNAAFDLNFLDYQLAEHKQRKASLNPVVDTLLLARRKHPGQSNSLDSLCNRYKIDLSKRDKHGALLDSFLLAEVYLELLGERQAGLNLVQNSQNQTQQQISSSAPLERSTKINSSISEEETELHQNFIKTLGDKAFWNLYS